MFKPVKEFKNFKVFKSVLYVTKSMPKFYI